MRSFLLRDWVVTNVFGEYYNNERYPESLDNLTPADVYFGRKEEVLSRREKIKEQTLRLRRKQNLQSVRVQVQQNRAEKCLLTKSPFCPILFNDIQYN